MTRQLFCIVVERKEQLDDVTIQMACFPAVAVEELPGVFKAREQGVAANKRWSQSEARLAIADVELVAASEVVRLTVGQALVDSGIVRPRGKNLDPGNTPGDTETNNGE